MSGIDYGRDPEESGGGPREDLPDVTDLAVEAAELDRRSRGGFLRRRAPCSPEGGVHREYVHSCEACRLRSSAAKAAASLEDP